MRLVLLLALVACQSSDVSRSLGARCDSNADCDEKCLPPTGDWPGGFCTTVCMTDSECGPDGVCIGEDGGVCVFACAGDANCAFLGAGYQCKEVDDRGTGAKVMVCRGG